MNQLWCLGQLRGDDLTGKGAGWCFCRRGCDQVNANLDHLSDINQVFILDVVDPHDVLNRAVKACCQVGESLSGKDGVDYLVSTGQPGRQRGCSRQLLPWGWDQDLHAGLDRASSRREIIDGKQYQQVDLESRGQ